MLLDGDILIDKKAFIKTLNQPDEKLLLARVLDQADLSLKNKTIVFTDFFDPIKTEKFMSILKKIKEINCCSFGGTNDCERKLIGIYPDFLDLSENDFPIIAIKVTIKNKKFSKPLSHRDFLGSILGLGIDRGKTGDILLFEDYAVCFVKSDISQFIDINLDKVSNTYVDTEINNIFDLNLPKANVVEKSATVSSMRLDAVLSSVFNISRGKSKELIEGEKVTVNWTVLKNCSYEIKKDDMISLRGMGRGKITEINDKKTKSNRIVITFCRYK